MELLGHPELDRKYEILKLIGSGGMGSKVYLVQDKKLNREWAIKKIRKSKTSSEKLLMAEANIMKSLDHPMLPRIVSIEEDERYFYIVMDYIQGENLRNILAMNGPQEQKRVIEWGIRLCDALSYLNKKGIIYRDMKPSNIILTPDGNLKLVDFGISKDLQDDSDDPLGTKGYAAPEQYEGGTVDERTDVYGLGVTLFHLLTGKNPKDYAENVYSIRVINPYLSSGLDKIILKATQKDPSKRFQNAKEFKTWLANYQKLDTKYINRQKKILKGFTRRVIVCLVCFILAGGTYFANAMQTNNRFNSLIQAKTISKSEEAIKVKPSDKRGYETLLSSYGDEITSGEFSDFNHLYSKYYSKMSKDDRLTVSMDIGEKLLSSYEDKSIRGRLLVAEPYFDFVKENGNEDFDRYTAATCYTQMIEFYKDFVIQDENVILKEAKGSDFTKLLRSMKKIVTTASEYKGSEKKSLLFSICSLNLGIIDTEVTTMEEQGVSKEDVLSAVNKMESVLNSTTANTSALREKKTSVLSSLQGTKKKIDIAYSGKKEDKNND